MEMKTVPSLSFRTLKICLARAEVYNWINFYYFIITYNYDHFN
jgi:hypothetical protein